MSIQKKDLILLFYRPSQPCFMPIGEKKIVFDVPEDYYPDKFKPLFKLLVKRFKEGASRIIPVKKIAIPNLEVPLELPYEAQFSLFIAKHREIAGSLIDIMMGTKDLDDFLALSVYCQLRVNPFLFNYSYSVTLLNRPDTEELVIPTLAEVYPDKFMDPRAVWRARMVDGVTEGSEESRPPIMIPPNFTASDAEPEQRLAYFREDIGVNLHHWHWHLVYPSSSSNRAIVAKDRRGELLYYMHQQIIARYNVARFCNNLSRTVPFGSDLRQSIDEAYFPKLNSQIAGRYWPPRFPNTVLKDVTRANSDIVDISLMEFRRTNIIKAIESNSIITEKNEIVPLDEETGIDVLGNLMEASMLSPNKSLYGDFHNKGHILIASAHDPNFSNLEDFAVMGDTSTAMRDPVFYRWHTFIDDIFVMYKRKLPPYESDKLHFSDVRVGSIKVDGKAGTNILTTQWEQTTFELGRGLDFAMNSDSIKASYNHLRHDDFEYVIEVENTSEKTVTGTVRIFIAPVADETGRKLEFDEQRRLMIELDKFAQELTPGKNTVRRKSEKSSVTIPYDRIFRNLNQEGESDKSKGTAAFNFCGCGWPHYMLIPKGTEEGYPMVLFVMVSNWADDRVSKEPKSSMCEDAASYCGLRDRKYPDRQSMGFPFDRPAKQNVKSVDDFLTPNMAVTNCKIHFSDVIRVHHE